MKKLIAMLLCVAMIAAFGVNAFAIVGESTPSEKDALTAAIKTEKDAAAKQLAEAEKFDRVATFFNELEKIGKAWAAENAKATTPEQVIAVETKYNNQIAALGGTNKDLAAFVKEATDGGLLTTLMGTAILSDGSDWDYSVLMVTKLDADADGEYADFDPDIIQAMNTAGWRESDAENHLAKVDTLQADLQVILDEEAEAAAEAAKAAEEAAAAAKEEAAARRAAAAAVKDPKTPAEWMKYWAAYDKYWLDKDLSSSKDAANKAKDGIKTAQEAAFAQAKNAVERAQIEAYGAMQDEINKAVSDYIAGVQVALGDFYYELYN